MTPAATGPMRGNWNPALMHLLFDLQRQLPRALDAAQTGDTVPEEFWQAIEKVREGRPEPTPCPDCGYVLARGRCHRPERRQQQQPCPYEAIYGVHANDQHTCCPPDLT